MKTINLIQVIVSVLLMITILLQNRGAGLGSTFGGDFGGYYTKRGMEKFLFYFSIGLSALFLGLALTSFILAGRGV
jgi:protein translocase SecG subunit